MVDEQNLASAVSDYIAQANGLETTRRALVDRIMGVVKTEIIPEISPLLPDRYSIDTDRIDVSGIGGDSLPYLRRDVTYGTVPTGFSVSLRLLYDGKPIDFHDEGEDGLAKIQNGLRPKLGKLAEKHNLDDIIPLGEPIQM